MNRDALITQAKAELHARARTSLVAHVIECEHGFDFAGVTLLHREPNWHRRTLIETLYITMYGEQAVNHKRETSTMAPDLAAALNNIIAINKRANNS